VTTVLQYLVIAAVIGLVMFALAVFVFGRGEQLAPLSPRTSPTELPEHGMTGADVSTVKFAMALRGYRMSDVDWALERMAGEIDRLRAEIATLSGGDGSTETEDTADAEQPVFAEVGPSRVPSTQPGQAAQPGESAQFARPSDNPSAQTTGDS
jgi:DivIVA domain-containing protein